MPLVDMHCVLGTTPETGALPHKSNEEAAREAVAYADRFDVMRLCFSAAHAATDPNSGLADLLEMLMADGRFFGWLSLPIHQPEEAAELARAYLVKPEWCGALIEQPGDADTVTSGGGHEVLNALRRYSKPVLLTTTTPATLDAAVHAASDFSTLRFLISPQNESGTRIAVPAIKEVINTSLLPVAAFAERGSIQAAVETLGERRVLWGSNWGRFHPAAALGMIRDAGLTTSQRERLGWRNAAEILGE